MKDSTIKLLGLAATAVGLGASLLSGYIGDKKVDASIEEKIAKALAEKDQ